MRGFRRGCPALLPLDAPSSQPPRICLLAPNFFLLAVGTSSCGVLLYSPLGSSVWSSSAETVSIEAGAEKAARARDVIWAPTQEGPHCPWHPLSSLPVSWPGLVEGARALLNGAGSWLLRTGPFWVRYTPGAGCRRRPRRGKRARPEGPREEVRGCLVGFPDGGGRHIIRGK